MKEGANKRENKRYIPRRLTQTQSNVGLIYPKVKHPCEELVTVPEWQKPLSTTLTSFNSSSHPRSFCFLLEVSLSVLDYWERGERERERGRERGRERSRGREEGKKERMGGGKTLSKQQEGQEKYLIQTMNIVISSHSLHSQSSSTGRLGEPRNAELPGSRVCVAGAPGGEHACRGLRWNIPVVSLGCFNLPWTAGWLKNQETGTGGGEGWKSEHKPHHQPQAFFQVSRVLSLSLGAGPPPLTSACFLWLSPPCLPGAWTEPIGLHVLIMWAGVLALQMADAQGGSGDEGPPTEVPGSQAEGPTCWARCL